MKKNTLAAGIRDLRDRMKLDQKSYRVYSILRVLVILIAVRSFFTGNFENVALCLLSLVLFLGPVFAEKTLKIDIPQLFQVIIYLFIYAAWIMGEIENYYTIFPGWDTMLHTLNGFLCAAVGFSMVYLLNQKSENINLSPFYLAMVAFCFSMTIGVIWEFFEFTMDQVFHLDMQKDFIVKTISSVTLDPKNSQTPYVINHITRTIVETADGSQHVIEGGYLDIGIIDTMKDLLVNLVGAIVFSVFGYIYLKHEEAAAGKAAAAAMAQADEKMTKKGQRMVQTGQMIADGFLVKPLNETEVRKREDEVRKIKDEQKKGKGENSGQNARNRRKSRRRRKKQEAKLSMQQEGQQLKQRTAEGESEE